MSNPYARFNAIRSRMGGSGNRAWGMHARRSNREQAIVPAGSAVGFGYQPTLGGPRTTNTRPGAQTVPSSVNIGSAIVQSGVPLAEAMVSFTQPFAPASAVVALATQPEVIELVDSITQAVTEYLSDAISPFTSPERFRSFPTEEIMEMPTNVDLQTYVQSENIEWEIQEEEIVELENTGPRKRSFDEAELTQTEPTKKIHWESMKGHSFGALSVLWKDKRVACELYGF